MSAENKLVEFAILKPRLITALIVLTTMVLGAFMVKVHVDTDPENMLAKGEAVRIFHNLTKKEFELNDMVILGIVNEAHPDGVFNPATLQRVAELTEFAGTLSWPDPEKPVHPTNAYFVS